MLWHTHSNSLPIFAPMKKIWLNKGKDQSALRRHPWIYSGAVKKVEEGIQEGDAVEVYSAQNQLIGVGHYQPANIAVRLLAFEPAALDEAFWQLRLQQAWALRQQLGLIDNKETTAYRLVFAEGDQLPGLILDVYGSTAVLQAHSLGMWRVRQQLAQAVVAVAGGRITAVYDKSAETLHAAAGAIQNSYLIGEGSEQEVVVMENGVRFKIDWIGGQKTGFFLDQRENRALLAQHARGKRVLNTFCYTGGFSVYALQAGATEVHSVDVSAKAVALTDENVALNGGQERHQSFAMDTFAYLKEKGGDYDIVILDPPAFAKSMGKRHNALMGYKRLNYEAIRQLQPGGLLYTFSCSGVVDKQLFQNIVMSAAIEAGRPVRVLHQLSQPADHPYSLYHPEGEYLKGLVLQVM
ncbi:Ribosomal RNA large subunit methyltransferase I [Cesiribacter andamanensis AMV16]|uniref:Ribosomal RNA large subunit methyltransferase I n=2 Tax=Cesiribacter TaxID=1133570 RepID=M7N670_9BACT|nr:Ribosomal RNA large subunit methyltransferase I [Cesiribacter andamanensis AMV16]